MSHRVTGKTRAVLRHTAAASVVEIYWNEVQPWEETEKKLQPDVMMDMVRSIMVMVHNTEIDT